MSDKDRPSDPFGRGDGPSSGPIPAAGCAAPRRRRNRSRGAAPAAARPPCRRRRAGLRRRPARPAPPQPSPRQSGAAPHRDAPALAHGAVDASPKTGSDRASRRRWRPRHRMPACGWTIWSRPTPTRSCGRPARCCCCSAACASRCCAPRSPADGAGRRRDQVLRERHPLRRHLRSSRRNSAKYMLCATADDIVQNIPTEDRHVWTQYSMLSRFFGERIGGVRFFESSTSAKLDPLVNYPLLELQHACLALGFQGMHRTSAGGRRDAAADPARPLRDAAPGAARRSMRDLSPRWQGQALAVNAEPRSGCRSGWSASAGRRPAARRCSSRCASCSAASAEAVADSDRDRCIRATELDDQAPASSPPPPPPPPPPPHRAARAHPQRRSSRRLQPWSSRRANADRHPAVRTWSCSIPARRPCSDEFKPIAARIAAHPRQGAGHDQGRRPHRQHADQDSVRFPSNYELSVERAQGGRRADQERRSPSPDRIEVDGKGADVPIAPQRDAGGARQEPPRRNRRSARTNDGARNARRCRNNAPTHERRIRPRSGIAAGSASALDRRLALAGLSRRAADRDRRLCTRCESYLRPRRSASSLLISPRPRRRLGSFAVLPAPASERQGARRGHQRGATKDESDDGRPQGQDEGRARDAEDGERRQEATSSTICPGT